VAGSRKGGLIKGRLALATAAAALLVGGCGDGEANNAAAEAEQPKAEPVRPSADDLPPGTTPVAERVAVLGLLNKRSGSERDVELRPGQAVRIDNVVIRLRTCETTAPWEPEQWTGAFVQVDVRNPQNEFQRVFSGWLYKESPSLNVVEHPIYDVWVKSCAMTHPEAAPSSGETPAPANASSSAPKSGSARPPRAARRPAPAPDTEPAAPTPAPSPPRTPSNSAANNSR
jgi:hypothetical protein